MIDFRRVQQYDTDDGGGDSSVSSWHDEFSKASPDRAETYGRYKSVDEFHNAFFEQRKQISKTMTPPDPTSENYLDAVKQARLKLGGKANASEYTVTIPDDIEGLDKEAFTKQVTERAVKFGVTQAELDTEVTAALEDYKATHAASVKAAEDAENAKNKAIAEMDETLGQLYGARKEQQMNNAILMAKHYDDGMFAQENGALPEEVRAEKGGLLVQKLKNSNDPMLYRMFAVLHDQILSEGTPPPGGRPASGEPATNVQVMRYDEAKARWPERGEEFWQRYSKENRR